MNGPKPPKAELAEEREVTLDHIVVAEEQIVRSQDLLQKAQERIDRASEPRPG